jgi:hypothetical protein
MTTTCGWHPASDGSRYRAHGRSTGWRKIARSGVQARAWELRAGSHFGDAFQDTEYSEEWVTADEDG